MEPRGVRSLMWKIWLERFLGHRPDRTRMAASSWSLMPDPISGIIKSASSPKRSRRPFREPPSTSTRTQRQISAPTVSIFRSSHHWRRNIKPQVTLDQAIAELKALLESTRFSDPNFRQSRYMRLNMLSQLIAGGRLDSNLDWVA